MNLDMEELKRKAQFAKQAKKARMAREDPSSLQPTDILFILHKDEVETLEDVLLDVLEYWDDSLLAKQKWHILNVLKYIQEDGDNGDNIS